MSLFSKKKKDSLSFDAEHEYPVIRSSICTGEKVAGFKDKDTGKFRDIMLIRNDSELEDFKNMCGVDNIKVEY